jgi:hypothetical protein
MASRFLGSLKSRGDKKSPTPGGDGLFRTYD